MSFRSFSNVISMVFIMGITTSQACKLSDLTKCLDTLTGIKIEELQDGCNAITSVKTCLQSLLDSGSCAANINNAIESNMGTVESLEDTCAMATGQEAVVCTANGVIKCSKPVKRAQEDGVDKEMLCNAWKFAQPCLVAIGDTCKNKKWISKIAKVAVKTFDTVAAIC